MLPSLGGLNSPLEEITWAARAASTHGSFTEMAEGMKRQSPPQVTAALLKRNTRHDFLHAALMGPSQRESWENTYSTAGYRQEVNERTVKQAQIQHFSPHIKWGYSLPALVLFSYTVFSQKRGSSSHHTVKAGDKTPKGETCPDLVKRFW